MELSYHESQIHIDHGKKAYVGPEKDVYQKSAEKSHPDPLLIAFDKSCGAGKNKKDIGHDSTKINHPEYRCLQYERKQNKYEIKNKSSYIHILRSVHVLFEVKKHQHFIHMFKVNCRSNPA